MSSALALTVFTVLASLFCCTPVEGICPDGWTHHNESCFLFVKRESAWHHALAGCIRYGARLAKIETTEENEFLRKYLIDNGRYFSGYDMWLGANKDGRGNWQWADGTPLVAEEYDDWQVGEPSSGQAETNFCLELEADYTYHWSDDNCDDLNYGICERPFEPPTPPPIPVG